MSTDAGPAAVLWNTWLFFGATRRAIHPRQEHTMSKRARKRRSRKGNAANHGRKPNA